MTSGHLSGGQSSDKVTVSLDRNEIKWMLERCEQVIGDGGELTAPSWLKFRDKLRAALLVEAQPPVEHGVVERAVKEFERRSKAAARASCERDAMIGGRKERREGVSIAYKNAAKYLRPFATKGDDDARQ